MSAEHGHGHDSHAHDHSGHGGHGDHGHGHSDHGGHDSHGGHGHDNGHGHEEHWGDYNSEPLPPSNLPPVTPPLLIAFGAALAFLICMIVASSLMLASSREGHLDAENAEHRLEGQPAQKE